MSLLRAMAARSSADSAQPMVAAGPGSRREQTPLSAVDTVPGRTRSAALAMDHDTRPRRSIGAG